MKPDFFTALPNTFALVSRNGALSTAPVYEYDNQPYLRLGSSYYRVTAAMNIVGIRNGAVVEIRGDHAERIQPNGPRLVVRDATPVRLAA